MRLFQQFGARLLSNNGYIALKPCAQIASDGVLTAAAIVEYFPGCAAYFSSGGGSEGAQQQYLVSQTQQQMVVVEANYAGLPIEINVALSFAAGASAFLALIVHIFGAELYVSKPSYSAKGGRGGSLRFWAACARARVCVCMVAQVLTVNAIAPPHARRVRPPPPGLVSQADGRRHAASGACWADGGPRGRCGAVVSEIGREDCAFGGQQRRGVDYFA